MKFRFAALTLYGTWRCGRPCGSDMVAFKFDDDRCNLALPYEHSSAPNAS